MPERHLRGWRGGENANLPATSLAILITPDRHAPLPDILSLLVMLLGVALDPTYKLWSVVPGARETGIERSTGASDAGS
ncbi:MAG TPA: hypothetical protein PLR09_07105 [Candidatus Methanoculleus thermohydrogenotrophicum]|nr:hypothetical protein [Candidatus Methanoculleus thermohydrogenotrophicum]